MRQVFSYPPRSFDEVDCVVIVLVDTGGDRENIRIKNNVFRRKTHALNQKAVSAFANFDLALESVSLPGFIESHHDHRRAITPAQRGLSQKFFFAFFQRDRVNDGFALYALQTCLDHTPFGGVDHDRHACNIRLGRDQIQEARHRSDRVEHRLIHIDVDDLRAIFNLLPRNSECLFVLLIEDHAREGFRARDIGALTHIHKQRVFVDGERLQARQFHLVKVCWH